MKRVLQLEDFRLAVLSVWKKKAFIILFTIAGLFLGLLLSSTLEGSTLYTSKSSVYVAAYNTDENILSSMYDAKVVTNYTEILTSKKVCDYAASLISETKLSGEDIQSKIAVEVNESSYVITINSYSGNSDEAIKIANAVAEAFVSEMSNITDAETVHGLDSAEGAYEVADGKINLIRMAVPGMFFALSVALIGMKSLLSDRIRSLSQCVSDEDEILGIIPELD